MIEPEILHDQLDYDRYKDNDKVLQFRAKLRKFTEEYLSKHTYIRASTLAKEYLAFRGGSKRVYPTEYNTIIHRLTVRFSRILMDFQSKGILKKYNNSGQYKKIVKPRRPYIEVPRGYIYIDYKREKLEPSNPYLLHYKDGSFKRI